LFLRAPDYFFDERGLSGTEKTRYDEDFHCILS
jgi:hypothetical protein